MQANATKSNAYPRPLCTSPVVIFNRGAVTSILQQRGFYRPNQSPIDNYQEDMDLADYQVHFVVKSVYRQWLSPMMLNLWATSFDYGYFNRMLHFFYNNGKDSADGLNWDLLQSYYTENLEGERIYLFLAVPCGHCEICTDKRQNDFSTRVNMESACSYTQPIMVTLTYNEENLPCERLKECSNYQYGRNFAKEYSVKKWVYSCRMPSTRCDGDTIRPTLHKPDAIQFFNLLRKKWTRGNYFPFDFGHPLTTAEKRADEYRQQFPFRYVCVGEYGSHYGRPHMHLILWNVPYRIKSNYDFGEIARLKSDIIDVWDKCDWFYNAEGIKDSNCIQCEVARDAGKYVGKYLSKECPNGRKGFLTASNGNGGGIGHQVIDNNKEYFYQYPEQQQITFIGKDGRVNQYTLGRYATKRLFPSALAQIPDQVKQFNREMVNELSDISQRYSQIGLDYHDELQSLADSLNHDSFHLSSRLGNGFSEKSPVLESFHIECEKLEKRVQILIDKYQELQEKYNIQPLDIVKQCEKNNIHNNAIVRTDITDEQVLIAKANAKVKQMDMLNRESF